MEFQVPRGLGGVPLELHRPMVRAVVTSRGPLECPESA